MKRPSVISVVTLGVHNLFTGGGNTMNNQYPNFTARTDAALLRDKAELALWLVGMLVASLYVLLF
jgi:hypothetical protein